MKHRFPARNYRNLPCAICAQPTPHDEAGCVVCAILAADEAAARRETLAFWFIMAPIGVACIVLAMCL